MSIYINTYLLIHIVTNYICISNAIFKSDWSEVWPTPNVWYNVAPEMPQEYVKVIKRNIEYINNLTCVQWNQRYPWWSTVQDYVSFQYNYADESEGTYCEAAVGWKREQQVLYVGADCMNRSLDGQRTAILHEMMHSMGFYHEQQRPNRNCYVFVPEAEAKKSPADLAILPYPNYFSDWPYDFESIMHYPKGANVWPRDKTQKLSREDGTISPFDIEKLNFLYCDKPSYCPTVGKAKCDELKKIEKQNPNCKTQLPG
uniref:Metalloendopeptidase n=1 Tax=Graphocephala atropunctata TaxID=36148 RepID=A0A1B6LDX1_9HEMI